MYISFLEKMSNHRVQQVIQAGLTINIRHAKIMLCGASKAGKTSFSRLLRSKGNVEGSYISTPLGETKQILSRKVDVTGTEWVDLDIDLQIEKLTKKMISELQNSDLTDADKQPDDTATDNKMTQSNESSENLEPDSNVAISNSDAVLGNTTNNAKTQISDQASIEEEMGTKYIDLILGDPPTLDSDVKTWDYFTLLDTGGQPEFINMLPAINPSTDINFVVLNMSKGKECLDSHVIAQCNREGYSYPKHDLKYTNMELLECLLSSIKIAAITKKENLCLQDIIKIVKEDEHFKPLVCFIGTHADEIKEKCDEVVSHINKKISDLEVIRNKDDKIVIWCDGNGNYIRPVDNTIFTDIQKQTKLSVQNIHQNTIKTVQCIRNELSEILMKKSEYEIPFSWFILELELHKFCEKNKKVCVSLDDIKKISDRIMPADKKMEILTIKKIMKFYHMFGTLLFFDKVDGMNNFVITDPQWLFTNLTKIVMCKFDENHAFYDAKHINKLKRKGICSTELLKKLDLNLQHIEMESFLNLLEHHLKVIAPVDYFHNEYFIPSVLPPCGIEHTVNEEIFGKGVVFNKTDGQSIKIHPLLIGFTFGTIPRGLFGFLVVQLIQDNPRLYTLENENNPVNNIYFCYADLIILQIEPWWYVTLIDKISYLELQVRVRGNHPSYHLKVQRSVTNALKKLCEKFDLQFSESRYGFLCESSFCSKSKHHMSLLSASEPIPTKMEDFTICSRCRQSMEIDKIQKIWFEARHVRMYMHKGRIHS